MLTKLAHRGWPNVYRLSNGHIELLVSADVGPRILSYGFSGRNNSGANNLFKEIDADYGQTGGDKFRFVGGHRFWVTPENEATYFPDNRPVPVAEDSREVRFIAPVEDYPIATNLQKEISLRISPDESCVTVTHTVTNFGSSIAEHALWALTMFAPGGHAIFPLPFRERDNASLLPESTLVMWPYTDLSDPRWRFGHKNLQLAQDSRPTMRREAQKIGFFNPEGWGAYFRNGLLFVKRIYPGLGKAHPDMGCNYETYTDSEMLEVETLSPIHRLKPNESAAHVERWWLFDGVPDGTGDSWYNAEVLPRVLKTSM
jgi:hypothetical protein